MTNCPFCDIETKFKTVYFSQKEKTEPCEGWIDYDLDENGKFLWYAFLNGEQFTRGNTLVVLGSHMEKIIDPNQNANIKELESIILGINRVSAKLKTKLEAHNIHVLCLCDGIPHLHFHLIPRYNFTDKEKRFFIRNYWHREKPNYKSYSDFKIDVISGSKNINGMWYAAFKEMNFKNSAYNNLSLKLKKQYIEKLAKLIRDEKLVNPFSK